MTKKERTGYMGSFTTTEKMHFHYDGQGKPAMLMYNGTRFGYLYNAQGDVIGIITGGHSEIVKYTYDAWGKLLSITGSGKDDIGKANPFRYRAYVYDQDFEVDYCMDTPEEIAAAINAQRAMGYPGGMLITNPIPHEYAMPKAEIDAAIEQALREADGQGIKGKATTPFLLARVCELTGGESLKSNIRLVLNNVALGAQIAVAMQKQEN